MRRWENSSSWGYSQTRNMSTRPVRRDKKAGKPVFCYFVDSNTQEVLLEDKGTSLDGVYARFMSAGTEWATICNAAKDEYGITLYKERMLGKTFVVKSHAWIYVVALDDIAMANESISTLTKFKVRHSSSLEEIRKRLHKCIQFATGLELRKIGQYIRSLPITTDMLLEMEYTPRGLIDRA